jgi:sigma54-dependent transcription regulator
MNFDIDFAPLLPWPLIGLFAALTVATIFVMILKRIKGGVLRGLTASLLLASLANPTIRQDERQPLTDIAVIIVDESQSQSIGNRTAQTQKALDELKSRIAKMGNMAQDCLQRLSKP